MPPKKKKSAKKKGKKSGDKKKRDGADVVTFKEAVMLYQLEVKQAQLNDLKEDIDDLNFRIEKQKQRNQFLKKEQNRHVKDVIGEARKKEEETKNEAKIPFEDVEKALQEKLASLRLEETSLEEVKQKISISDEKIQLQSKELLQLIHYKEVGETMDKTNIELLNKELKDMDDSYAEMADFFEKSLEAMKHAITKQNEDNITQQKKLASEQAIHNLDKQTEQEFLDNKWLLREVDINQKHIATVEQEVEMLERQNIEIMSELFGQQLEDVHETRRFYIACKEDQKEPVPLYSDDDDDDDESESDEIIEEHGDISESEELPDDNKWLEDYLPELDGLSYQDDYKLGPMEIKLLCVTGRKCIFHEWKDENGTSGTKDVYKKWNVERDELKRIQTNEPV